MEEYTQEFSTHTHEVERSPNRTFSIEEHTSSHIKTIAVPLNDVIATLDQVTTLTKETICSARHMNFKRVQRRIRGAGYDFATSDRHISLDVKKSVLCSWMYDHDWQEEVERFAALLFLSQW